MKQNKNLIFQVNISSTAPKPCGSKNFFYTPTLFEFSNQRAEQYAHKCGADYFCLDTAEWLGHTVAPVYHKMFVFELFKQGYDRIFWIDSDAVFTPIAPNVFDVFEGFSAVREHNPSQRGNQQIGCGVDWRYFMSGQMMLTREWYEVCEPHWRRTFEEMFTNPHAKHDQGIFNRLAHDHYPHYTDMGQDWGSWQRVGRYIRHYWGPTKKSFDLNRHLAWESKLK